MDYRGGDLDLRLPGNRPGGSGDNDRGDTAFSVRDFSDAPASQGSPNTPIYVDDTLMSVCNHAYDVAVAHRSADVRIEHLLYALTRIDAAAEVLEAAGIRDAGLRREGATIIASEIPIGLTNGTSKPRRSGAFEEALRLAAQQGYRRNRPASVADLLHVFLEVKPDLPGLDLLRRHIPRSYREADEFVGVSVPPPRYQPAEPPPRYIETRYRSDLLSDPRISEPRPIRYEPQEAVDTAQNMRLADLEHMVRGLRDELGSERQMFGNLLGDLKRDVSAQRSASTSLSSVMQDRLASLEQSFVGVGSGSGDGGAAVREIMERTSERLSNIERGVSGRIDELGRQMLMLSDKMEAINAGGRPDDAQLLRVGQQLDLLTQKFSSLEKATGDGDLDIDIMPLLARLDGVERALRDRDDEQGETLAVVSERLKGLERMVGAQPDVQVDLSSLEGRLQDIETAVLSQDGSTSSKGLDDRLDRLEQVFSQQFADMTKGLSFAGGADGDTTAALQAEIKALSGAIATGNASQERFASSLQTEIQSLAGTAGNGSNVADEILPKLQNRLQAISQVGERLTAFSTEHQKATNMVAAKLEMLEKRFTANDKAVAAGRADFVRELSDVHEAIMKLNSNQHAISQSMETWRAETVGSVNTVAQRISDFETRNDGPNEEIRALSANLDRMYHVTVERYHRRNRFWFWLFGTDDWVGASWPSQTARVELELAAMKRATAADPAS
ncbi:MAG: Clp protease N-terminal domain-containing protein [Pseudomonadota bacterium]